MLAWLSSPDRTGADAIVLQAARPEPAGDDAACRGGDAVARAAGRPHKRRRALENPNAAGPSASGGHQGIEAEVNAANAQCTPRQQLQLVVQQRRREGLEHQADSQTARAVSGSSARNRKQPQIPASGQRPHRALEPEYDSESE